MARVIGLQNSADKLTPLSHNPYSNVAASPHQDTRAAEAWAMVNLAQRLEKVRQDEAASQAEIREAVRLNWRVWSLLQEGFLSSETELPIEVRTNLLSLSRFIDKHSASLLRDPQTEGLKILISINRNLAEGLLGRAKQADGNDSNPASLDRQL